ncbi:MAG: hypothetical protein ACFFEE_02305 [Candidatus Thorarchaeota archaeon]
MKNVYLKIFAAFAVMVMISAISVGDVPESLEVSIGTNPTLRPIPSAIVWSDNFDDMDISDWQLFAVDRDLPEPLLPGNSTAEEGVLRHLGMEWAYAGHNSSVAFGSWSFDVDVQDNVDDEFLVLFMSEIWNYDWPERNTAGEAYGIAFYLSPTDVEIDLVKTSHDTGHLYLDEYTVPGLVGWNSFIVTRELSGQFYVYMNGELILEGKNMQHTTSERFYFIGSGGPAIDNITVDDDIIYDAAPPKWNPEPIDQMIDIGTDFHYDLNATDYSGIDQWWINDTVNFAINDDGVISNVDVLEAGSYVIGVSVNDTQGNTQTGSFRLTVRELPIPLPMELVIVGVGAAAVFLIVLVIWSKKR